MPPVTLGWMVTRRDVLKGALALGAGVAASAAGLTACSAEQARTFSFPVSSGPNLAAFSRRLRGQVILPTDPRYDSARVLFNSVYDYVRPIAIVQAASREDVQAAVEFAHSNDVALAIRGGGHSFAGYSTGPGIVLDVSRMNDVSVDTGGKTARVGAGGKLIDVTAALAPTGMAIPSGWCPTVGVDLPP